MTNDTTETRARAVLDAISSARSIATFSGGDPDFALADAYQVSDAVMAERIARGERVVGWKIGFTNSNIWDEYGVHAPIWGPMYDRSVQQVTAGDVVSLAGLAEPRIEPEIAFRLKRVPELGMDEAALLDCIDAVTHGFEIVQSIFPGWKFKAADTVAACALHGMYLHGELVSVEGDRAAWLERLAAFDMELTRDGTVVDRGTASDVLGGPLSALRSMVDGMAMRPMSRPLEAGDLITTGTVTRAFPVSPGERWTTRIDGVPLAGLDVRFSA